MVRRAVRRVGKLSPKPNNIHFFVADAENIPVRPGCADIAIFTGILHHVAHPERVITETARALKADGRLIGMENNRSLFRPIFDRLMKWKRLWNEEADPEHFVISSRELHAWFADAGVKGKAWTRVYVPPHVFNALPDGAGKWLLRITDAVGQRIPGLRHNGGLVFFSGEKTSAQRAVRA
jgi:ubiquinone/menaquinone biosynthesis C-methylase UbiE